MVRLVRERSDAVLDLAGTFRRHGFQGASLSTIQAETGLGRGSLYHFFPAGKTDMAKAVLDEVQAWFDREIYSPLRSDGDPETLIRAMVESTVAYFTSRGLVCLFAAITLAEERETFAAATRGYFTDWIGALTATIRRTGATPDLAAEVAVDTVSGIQGALILARALHDDTLFGATLTRIQARVLDAVHRVHR